MRERRKRMDVCEEVIDQEFEDGEGADRFGIEDCVGERCKSSRNVIW